MDLSKSIDYFNPALVKGTCHIIGCGSVGSTLAENLARLGIEDYVLYDFDNVEKHNIVNQMFTSKDIGKNKAIATRNMILDINPQARVELVLEGYTDQLLDGYVFMAVDSIGMRREIVENNIYNRQIKALFDFRTGLEDAQHFGVDWSNLAQIKNFQKTMNFTSEEAMEETPVSACGIVLGVAPTVRMVCTIGVTNFMNFILKGSIKPFVICNPFEMLVG